MWWFGHLVRFPAITSRRNWVVILINVGGLNTNEWLNEVIALFADGFQAAETECFLPPIQGGGCSWCQSWRGLVARSCEGGQPIFSNSGIPCRGNRVSMQILYLAKKNFFFSFQTDLNLIIQIFDLMNCSVPCVGYSNKKINCVCFLKVMTF